MLCDLVNEEFQERCSTDLRTNKYAHSQDMASEKLSELTTKINILCMEVHDNTEHIKLNENSVPIMGNDGERAVWPYYLRHP